jgi:hypothetical protein
MAKKQTGWRGWWQSLWEESVVTSVTTSTTVSETVSVAPSVAVSVAPSATVSVDPTPTSSGDSVTLFRPTGLSGLLVDEVASDTDLATHNEVIWYSNQSTLDALVGGPKNGAKEWWLSQSNWPTNDGHDNSSMQQEPGLDNLWSYRAHSCYQPDHYQNGFSGGYRIYSTAATAQDGWSWINHRKFVRTGVGNLWLGVNESQVTPMVPDSNYRLTEAYLRYAVYIEDDTLDGFNEIGCKLGGFDEFLSTACIMWYRIQQGSEKRWQLQCYWNGNGTNGYSGDLANWTGGSPSDYNAGTTSGKWSGDHGGPSDYGGVWADGSSQIYLYPETWHIIEIYLKLNSASGVRDGHRKVWFDNTLIVDHPTCEVHKYTGANPIEIAEVRNQFFQGGNDLAVTPLSIMHARTAAWCLASRRIGPPEMPPELQLDINSNSWASTWNTVGQRDNMQFASCHQHTDGRQLEFCMGQDARVAGDNTGVRWAEFTTYAAPTGGYLWANDDTNIAETDNMPSAYLPWKQWVALFGASSHASANLGTKIIDISGTPAAVFRNNDGSAEEITDYIDVTYPTGSGITSITPNTNYHEANFNPACLVNPNGTETFWFGGGQGSNFPNGTGSLIKILDDDPNYPGSGTPLRLRIFRPTGAMSPTHMRHMVRIGDWAYWGGGGVNPDSGTADLTRHNEFYRIYIPDLASNTFTQERITDGPTITKPAYMAGIENAIRFTLLCADTLRNKLILVGLQGVYRYNVPDDDGNDGTWEGPYTFGLADWADTISGGDVTTFSNWHGCVGTHRSDLRQTFFRYNRGKKWNRIKWGVR